MDFSDAVVDETGDNKKDKEAPVTFAPSTFFFVPDDPRLEGKNNLYTVFYQTHYIVFFVFFLISGFL